MSEDQPPPRIRIFLIVNNLPLFAFNSEVTSRIPKWVSDLSDSLPFTSNSMWRSWRFGVPICAGHHRRGLARFNCGNFSGSKVTSLDSPEASSTS